MLSYGKHLGCLLRRQTLTTSEEKKEVENLANISQSYSQKGDTMAYSVFRIVGDEPRRYAGPVSEMWKAECILKALGGFGKQFRIMNDESDPSDMEVITYAYQDRFKLTEEEICVVIERIVEIPRKCEHTWAFGGRVAHAHSIENVIQIIKEDENELQYVKPSFLVAWMRDNLSVSGFNRASRDIADLYEEIIGKPYSYLSDLYRDPIKVANAFTEYLMG